MNKRLFLHIVNDGVEVDVLELLTYTYNAKRMGGAPALSSTLRSLDILDINNKCWARFADENGVEQSDGEIFYVKHVPSNTKDNTDARYKYDIEFITERFVLDNIYIYDADASNGEGSASSKATNNTEFIWTGNLYSYLKKLDAALEYSFRNAPSSYIRYSVSTDGVNNDGEEKVISIKDMTFTAALQEVYKTFESPYYFDGKTIRAGEQYSAAIEEPFKYGSNDALLSISKTNANYKTVNRVTAVGSSDNLPYYYPNDSAAGEHEINTTNGVVVDNVNYDLLGLYVNLAKESYLKLSSRYDRDYSTKTTYPAVLVTGEKKHGTLTTPDSKLDFAEVESKQRAYAISRASYMDFSTERPSTNQYVYSIDETGTVVEDYKYLDKDFSGSGGSDNTNTSESSNPTAWSSVFFKSLVSKTINLLSSNIEYREGSGEGSDRLGRIYFDDIATTFSAYRKEKTIIKYEYNFKGYNLDSWGDKFSVTGVESISVCIKRDASIIENISPKCSSSMNEGSFVVEFIPPANGTYSIEISFVCFVSGSFKESNKYGVSTDLSVTRDIPSSAREYLLQIGTKNENGEIEYGAKNYSLGAIGLSLGSNTSDEGEIIISEGRNKMPNQKKLVPSIYRETYGAERFYEATNGTYVVKFYDEWKGEEPQEYKYNFGENTFANPFEGDIHLRREHVINIDDIKPTIAGTKYDGHKIDEILDVAFDSDDNNDFDEKGELKHGYFFIKLPKMGFNIFAMASEQGAMTISMTSGGCMSCNFEIGVGENTKKNIVEVDSNGDLVRDKDGNVSIGEALSVQNDTTDNEVWVAVKKEKSTFGVWMPDAKNYAVPQAGDTFVLLNIRLPKSYIVAAEKKLEEEIVKYLKEHNDEKFNFSVKLSRIFFAQEENKGILNRLNENSVVSLEYLGNKYSGLYVSSYQIRMNENEILPEISVTLTDSLAPNAAPMQNVINQVKAEVMSSVNSANFVAQAARSFIRKDQDDTTLHKISANSVEVSNSVTASGNIKTYSNIEVGGYSKLKRGVQTSGDVTIGDYREVLGNISGAKISKDGNASFNSIKANVMEIGSLTYNQVRATSAYTMFDDTATIIKIEGSGNSYILTLEGDTKDENTGDFIQPFTEGDIVFGKVNTMGGDSSFKYGECWMRVDEIIGDNTIRVTLYSDEQTPSGKNLPPNIDMLIAHRGNVDNDKPERQSTFFISSKDGNLVQLLGVNSPRLLDIDKNEGYSNYGVVLGKPTDDLHRYITDRYPYVRKSDPILFAKYGVFENFLQLDHKGQPIKTSNFRGEWSYDTAVKDPYRVTFTTYDTVTHNGSWWECLVDGTTKEPSLDTTYWMQIVSKGADSSVASYSIIPSTTVMYFDTKDSTLSVDRISVKVGEETAYGYHEIDSDDELLDRSLTLWYSIDGCDFVQLNISDSSLFELEDGSGFISSEKGLIFSLEGTDIDASIIKDNITLYLKDDNDAIRALFVIPFIKAGSFKSTVFTRDTSLFVDGYTPTGGTYHEPYPTDVNSENKLVWSDGIPEGTLPIYSSTCTFYGDGTNSGWSEPKLMDDTADFEVIYSPMNFENVSDARDEIPDGFKKDGVEIDDDWLVDANSRNWYDDDYYVDESGQKVYFEPIWMATNNRKKGCEWSDSGWVVTKIKGENVNPNLLHNTNFDLFEEDGTTLKYWSNQDGSVVVGGYQDSFNSWLTGNGRAETCIATIPLTIKKGDVYTLSCMAKNTPGTAENTNKNSVTGFLLWLPYEDLKLYNKKNIVGFSNAGTGTDRRIDVYFGETPNWETKSFTFQYNPQEGSPKEVSGVKIILYRWNGSGEFAQIKLEHGGIATAYTKHVDDLKGKNALSPLPNMIKNADFSDVSDKGKAVGWYPNARFAVISNEFNGTNAAPVETYSIYRNDYALVANKTYTLSFYIKAVVSGAKANIEFNLPGSSTFTATKSDGTVVEYIGSSAKIAFDASTSEYSFASLTFKSTGYDNSIPLKFGAKDGQIRYCMIKLEEGRNATGFAKHPMDNIGPIGDSGPVIYPAGKWVSNQEYKKENNTVPFVYYDSNENDTNDGLYYILQTDSVKSDTVPSEDSTNWKAMTQYEAIYAKFIMANFAKFGSENGGVFYDKWLFSQKGKDASGAEVTYGNDSIVNGEFSDNFTPNLALDFKNGKLQAQDAVIRGHIEATSGAFAGKLAATSGTIDSITATNLSVSSGKIGDFKIEGGIFNGEVYNTTGEGTHARGVYMTKDFIRLRYNKRVDGPDNKETYWQMQLGTQPQATNQADGLYLERVYSGTAVDAVYKPQIRLKSAVASAGGNGISILADGSILSKGAVVSLGTQGGFFSSSERLSIDKGCILFIPYNAQHDCYLPKIGELNKYFDSKTYSVEFKLVVCPYMLNSGTKNIYLRGDAESDLELTYDYVGDDIGFTNRNGYVKQLLRGEVYSIYVCSSYYSGGSNIGYTGQVVYMHVSKIG